MPFSYYEVYITSLRALTAMGFPYGLDEDAACMITWLELNKLEGIKTLSKISNNYKEYFKEQINLKDVRLKKSINLHFSSLLLNGPNLFDYLLEKTKKNKKLEIIFENCKDPIFIIPLTEKLSNKLKSINACWLDEKKKKICLRIVNNEMLIGELKNNIKIDNGQVFLQLSKKLEKDWKNNFKIKKIIHKINFSTQQKNLEKSLFPNLKHWEILTQIAQLTFVPTSKQSRKKGAGGGDDND